MIIFNYTARSTTAIQQPTANKNPKETHNFAVDAVPPMA